MKILYQVGRFRIGLRSIVRRLRRATASALEPREPEPDPRWDVPIRLTLRCATALRRQLGLDEETYVLVAAPAIGDSRAYVIYTALDEVKKTALHLMRLREYLSETPKEISIDRIDRLARTQVLEEINARQRRLIEVLVTLVLFETTNEQGYFAHLLLLEEIDIRVSSNADRKEFYGARSANLDATIDKDIASARALEATLDLTRAWYLKSRGPLPDRSKLSPGRIFSSVRERIRLCLPLTTDHEKLVLGLTYRAGYGLASESVHYATNPRDVAWRRREPADAAVSLGLVTFAILERCHRILGRPNVPEMKQLTESLGRSDAGIHVRSATARDIKVGDFVVAYGNLAEVLEVSQTTYGYRSYRVQYLAERPMPEIEEDWFPAMHVALLYTQTRMRRHLEKMLSAGELPPDIGHRMRDMSVAELQPFLRASMIDLWKVGLRDWTKSHNRMEAED